MKCHSLWIGEYELTEADEENSIWIYHSSREGGCFDLKELEKVIAKFYNDNF